MIGTDMAKVKFCEADGIVPTKGFVNFVFTVLTRMIERVMFDLHYIISPISSTRFDVSWPCSTVT